MAAYSHLRALPAAQLLPVNVPEWIRRTVKLETRVKVSVVKSQSVILSDADQLEQLLINLVRNAADATLETGGGVQVACSAPGAQLRSGVGRRIWACRNRRILCSFSRRSRVAMDRARA